jgi:lipoprotein signal peptidase|tara:strand:+ start:141 stop:323 length:183 start_codon:yes stop_codon:yes gene_type:complete
MKTLFFFIVFLQVGCASIGELAANAAAGAIGNMLDRRIENKIDNDKEKDNGCKDCEVDKR